MEMLSLLSGTNISTSPNIPSRPVLRKSTTPNASLKLALPPMTFQKVADDMMKKGIYVKWYQDCLKKDIKPNN